MVCRCPGTTEGGLHGVDDMRHRLDPRGAGDAVRAVSQEEAAASARPPPTSAAARPLGVDAPTPAARLRGAGGAVRERR